MPYLAVFLTTNNGLSTWNQVGSLSREIAIYKRFVAAGWKVAFFTYDRTPRVPEIGFAAGVYPQWPYVLPRQLNFLYHSLLPFRFFQEGKKADIIITNQAHSSGPAIIASRLWNAKLVARCGYVYGEAAEILGLSGKLVRKKISVEKSTFARSQICLVPAKELKTWVCNNYQIPDEKIWIMPNYVDTDLFAPRQETKTEYDIISIGRLDPNKRHQLLLETFAGTKTRIHIVGDGIMKNELRHLANEKKIAVQFTPRVLHNLLPDQIRNTKIYVILSRWEGHPKSLIEAMACGRACIGARSPGIENLLKDGETGILVDSEPRSLRAAVENLLRDRELRERLGKNAREYAAEHFSLDKIFPKYSHIFERLLDHAKGHA